MRPTTPEQKAARYKAYVKLPHVKAYRKAQRQRPEEIVKAAARHKAWYQKNKERIKEKNRKTSTPRSQTARHTLNQIKKSLGCIDCGFKADHRALEFDHVRGVKTRAVSTYRSLPAALKEAEKCEVRCSNCHSIRTYGGIVGTSNAVRNWNEYNTAGVCAGLL